MSLLLASVVLAFARQASMPTILPALVSPARLPPGAVAKVTYRWRAVPLEKDVSVFVHFVGASGQTVLQDDHTPPIGTSKWSGFVTYSHKIQVPKDLADGNYRIEAGLYTALPEGKGWKNLTLGVGKGVTGGDDGHYVIGALTVDHAAPPPPLDSDRKPTLDLKGYRMTFDEEFDGPLSVSAHGPNGTNGTRWIAHKPDGQDFGDARFTDPTEGFPFTVQGGLLQIEARKESDGWKAGLLSTCDDQGRGFAQTYGYFEMRARFPKGAGTWPAFWMLLQDHLVHRDHPDVEIDVVEEYGHSPDTIHTTLHLWNPGDHRAWADMQHVVDTTADFHRYGLMWDAKSIVWYFDGVEMFRQPTPSQANRPMYLLINLALGGGWPIDRTPNPSVMEVDYVRAYQKRR